MIGYGHFQARLALAGRSKVVRLFMPYEDTDGPLLFHEDRDLTIQAAPTAPYAPPADPGPLSRCSWCRRDVPAERVAPPGQPVSASPSHCARPAKCWAELPVPWTTTSTVNGGPPARP